MFTSLKKYFANETIEGSKQLINEKKYQDFTDVIQWLSTSPHKEISERAPMLLNVLEFLKDAKDTEDSKEILDSFRGILEDYLDAKETLAFLENPSERLARELRGVQKKKGGYLEETLKKAKKDGIGIINSKESSILKFVNKRRDNLKALNAIVEEAKAKDKEVDSSARKEYWEERPYGRKHIISQSETEVVAQIQIYPGKNTSMAADPKELDRDGLRAHWDVENESITVSSADGQSLKYVCKDKSGSALRTSFFGFGAQFESVKDNKIGLWHNLENVSDKESINIEVRTIKKGLSKLERA